MTRNFMIYTLHQIFFGLIRSRRKIWAGHESCVRDMRGAYRVLMVRPVGKRTLQRPRRRWENNTKNVFSKIWKGGHGLYSSVSG
jgi:hypothetical protein